ncbi:MAG TPA: STAS domain-containing protein [Bryobacteraceae bacterium]|nr:STAS domain-containing protein [Bryobacteraceae bacterium]
MSSTQSKLPEIFDKREQKITAQWLEQQQAAGRKLNPAERAQAARLSGEFVGLLNAAVRQDNSGEISGPAWSAVRDFLVSLSTRRVQDGYSPSETASFIFSLKQPLFAALREEFGSDGKVLGDEIWLATLLLDKLGLATVEAFQKTREDMIMRQQRELLELSTPVVRLWENILALPLIGTLDSARTQVVMQNLLDAIVQTRSDYAIIDITGVPVVDTLVAQHLLKTVAAARLMGADCLISGIRPQIAQTIIHLGVDLSDVTTKATLADAFDLALRRSGHKVVRDAAAPANAPAR